jgi:hypothetical protein
MESSLPFTNQPSGPLPSAPGRAEPEPQGLSATAAIFVVSASDGPFTGAAAAAAAAAGNLVVGDSDSAALAVAAPADELTGTSRSTRLIVSANVSKSPSTKATASNQQFGCSSPCSDLT